jgi:hypothetical protein
MHTDGHRCNLDANGATDTCLIPAHGPALWSFWDWILVQRVAPARQAQETRCPRTPRGFKSLSLGLL